MVEAAARPPAIDASALSSSWKPAREASLATGPVVEPITVDRLPFLRSASVRWSGNAITIEVVVIGISI